MIGVVDYGMGNLYSLSQALRRLDQTYIISDQAEDLDRADGLILPGVGAFKDAMRLLHEKHLSTYLRTFAETRPLLGICLGMQLLFDESEEGTLTKGLGLIPGRVVRFSGVSEKGRRYKVPHMGWNTLTFINPNSPLLSGVKPDFAYFVHSYFAELKNRGTLVAAADYYGEVPAVVSRGNVYGMQFHPEKSGAFGQALLRNYLQLACRRSESSACRKEKC
ncbi:imidazole glycerol phosphate synthase subunit HisH [Sporolactobacillus sp. CPB3-1]|uniref:Imidazole glycerol phosphate synthase subunit HisH n=1 Tax=Sporolactobacillus mangiferae TaxID=2940498 RepID=A0ABT0M7P9_9BACL|nr:imidazole glycerol phosphate synthase subunit HisH [Sporolactobacillus mangiferae]MCL1630628.1 imidazole glycerol phosphate synthase subunit HisH [Sporolactobacillus mangiferae]